jgi:hypothetical protein
MILEVIQKKICNCAKFFVPLQSFLEFNVKIFYSSCQIQNGGFRKREPAKEEPTTN